MAVTNFTKTAAAGLGQFGALSRLMHVGVLLLGPTTNLEFANYLACELLGCQSEDQLRTDWDRVSALLDFDTLSHLTRTRQVKVNFPVQDDVRPLRLEICALDEESGGYLILLRDPRSVQVLETDLLLASQMRAQNYLYGALLHDLRAPLNALQITLELLAETIGGTENVIDEMSPQRHVRVLRDELSRLNRTLRTVLDTGAPPKQEFKQFDLVPVLQEIEALLRPQARRQRIEMQIEVPSRFVPILGQHDGIKQSLLNIAINALEAMPTGGKLRVQLETREQAAYITCIDSGPGIPEELLDEIYRVHFTTKRSGTGMGLYVARLIFEAHGGEIHVENSPEGGACFHMMLPLAQNPAGVQPE